MKKFQIILSAMMLVFLLSPLAVLAAPTHANEVGLYTAPNGYGATGTHVMNTLVDVFMVLTKPTDVDHGGAPFASIRAYELALSFNPVPAGDLIIVNTQYPQAYLDIGFHKDINQGLVEFIVGISMEYPVPVVDEAVVLATLTFINFDPGMTMVSLGPATVQSIAGEMAFIGEDVNQIDVMHSVSGSHEAPVFIFNGEAVAIEKESFGNVKALYR